MSNKYSILWLDDEFEHSEISKNIPEHILDRYKDRLIINKVSYVDQCMEILKNRSNEFQAVIFDANGKSSKAPNEEANKTGFETLISLAEKANLPTYIFSGQLDKNQGAASSSTYRLLVENGFTEGVNLFMKGNCTVRGLLDKVVKDIDEEFVVFYSYPKILENVLQYGVNRKSAQALLMWMKDKKKPFPEYVSLRRIFYDEIVNDYLKKFFGDIDSIKSNCVTKECMSPWEKDIILFLFKQLINTEVHNWPSNDPCSQEIIANSFITAMNWYNDFRHKVEKKTNPHCYYTLAPNNAHPSDIDTTAGNPLKDNGPFIGEVEIDRDGFYHVGKYLLKPYWAEKNLGKKVKVVNFHYNDYQKIATYTEIIAE